MVGVPMELSTDQNSPADEYRIDTIRKFLGIGDLLRQLGSTGFTRAL
jgi:hypothetical protein